MRFLSRLAERLGGVPALAGALALFLITPGHPDSWVRGLPLHPVVTAIVLPTIFIVWARWPAPRWTPRGAVTLTLLGFTVLKVALGVNAPEPGALASYYGRARLTDAPERSLDFRHLHDHTRIDRVVDFDQWSLPVHFFNDNDRFNFYEPHHPDRLRLPLAATWQGWLSVPETRGYRLWLNAIGEASLSIDGQPTLSVSSGRQDLSQTDGRPLELSAGAHEIRIEYSRRQGQAALLAFDWDVEGDREPVGWPFLFTSPVAPAELGAQRVLRGLAWGLEGLVLGFAVVGLLGPPAGFGVRRGSPLSDSSSNSLVVGGPESGDPRRTPKPAGGPSRLVLGVWAAAVTLYGVVTSYELVGQTIILEGGQDWLTYEYYARDILLNGPLMTLGKALGQGRAFVFQPLYPYYLAVLHALLGEGIYGPQVAHVAGFGIMGIVLVSLARALFGRQAAWLTLLLSTVLIVTQLDVVARRLLSENLYFFVLPAAMLAVVLAGRSDSWRLSAAAGLLLGIATLTRAPTLLLLPVAAVALLMMRRPRGTMIMLTVACLVVGLAPLRNYIVSGRPALVATNAGATLLLAHPPTPQVRLRGLDQHPVYNRLGIDRQTREVLEFVIQDPVGYAATLVPLAAYTLGFPGAVEAGEPPAVDLILLVALYLGATIARARARSRETWLSHAFITSHFLVMITFLPYVYGYRQVLPMYVIMLPFCAAGLAGLLRPPPVRGCSTRA